MKVYKIIKRIITQEPETIEKPNIFTIESVTTEHPNTVTKLSKPKFVTQQPNKIKAHTESKATNGTLQLDIIKSHYLHNLVKLKS